MSEVSPVPSEPLPTLIDRASQALLSARDSAEVLEARDMARLAYDAAKSAARMARAKSEHDSIISEVHRAQAHSLAIRARAEMRLAEEYDAAQEAGEVRKDGQRGKAVEDDNGFCDGPASVSDLGLRRDKIHEARHFRDAERDDPGVIERTIDGMVARGEEPTRAKLRREVSERKPRKVMDPKALWLWGRLNDFERQGILAADQPHLLSEMTEPMRADVRRLLPLLRAFIEEMEIIA